MPFLTNLVAYWKMDETSGTRFDVHGTNDLTDNGGTGSATGKLGNTANFNGSSQYLYHASNAALETGDIDFTIQAWVYFGTLAPHSIVAKDTDTGRDYTLDYDAGGFNCFRFYLNGGLGGMPLISASGTFAVTTWYHVMAWHDSAANLIGIAINAGTPVTASTTGIAPNISTGTQFRIGARQYPSNPDYMSGYIDEVGFWKRMLTAQERTDLYNGGSGLPYSSFTGAAAPSARPAAMLLNI